MFVTGGLHSQLLCCVVVTVLVIALREHYGAVHADSDLLHMTCFMMADHMQLYLQRLASKFIR